MKYGDRIIKMEGVIVELRDEIVVIDLKGRLGYLEVPKRMMIAEYPLMVGQEVLWDMSFVEQLGKQPEDDQSVGEIKTVYGSISEVHDGCVASEFENGLGHFKVPMRMMITDYYPEPGQAVGWRMSSIKQMGPEINDKYVSNLDVYNRRQAEARAKNEANN